MNQIRAIQALNKREIENGVPPEASWHTDYRDTAFVNFGGLPYELSEGDVITIFSQFGEPVFVKLARDKETGRSKGFGWLKYEDQRSCDLAVDNLGGATVAGRLLRVDHARYKPRDDEDPDEFRVGWEDVQRKARGGDDVEMRDASAEEDAEEVSRPLIKEERELARLIEEHDEDDPMKAYLVEEKKKEVEQALRKKHNHRHHHHHHHHRSSHRSSKRDHSEDESKKRSARDETPKDKSSRGRDRDRDETPEARRRGGSSRDRERRSHRHHRNAADDDEYYDRDRRRDRDRNRERRRDHRDDRDGDRDGGRDRRSRHDEAGDKKDGDDRRRRSSKSRRRSRSRSPV
ncbi:hypothetical protein F4810DRAFT_317355 [Camillea tinctor]|nr:hypothetical protein F4810DRAFT_317355 [Camillea tinctor]